MRNSIDALYLKLMDRHRRFKPGDGITFNKNFEDIKAGDIGIVLFIDDVGTIHVRTNDDKVIGITIDDGEEIIKSLSETD